MSVLLSLDLSTTATGWAKFDLMSKKLLSYGFIKPDFKNPTKGKIPAYSYPQLQVLKLRRLSEQVMELITDEVSAIVIEEINRGKNRLGQKVLDGFHFMLLEKMTENDLFKVSYRDSDGSDGWRSARGLKLQLTETDKLVNKDRKKFNARLKKGDKNKLPLITQKTLACRYVNAKFQLNLDADLNPTDGDVADAIGLGDFTLTKVLT